MKYNKYVPSTAKLLPNKDDSDKKVKINSGLLKKETGTILFGPYNFTYTCQEKVGERMRPKEYPSCTTYLVKLDNWRDKILQFAKTEVDIL